MKLNRIERRLVIVLYKDIYLHKRYGGLHSQFKHIYSRFLTVCGQSNFNEKAYEKFLETDDEYYKEVRFKKTNGASSDAGPPGDDDTYIVEHPHFKPPFNDIKMKHELVTAYQEVPDSIKQRIQEKGILDNPRLIIKLARQIVAWQQKKNQKTE